MNKTEARITFLALARTVAIMGREDGETVQAAIKALKAAMDGAIDAWATDTAPPAAGHFGETQEPTKWGTNGGSGTGQVVYIKADSSKKTRVGVRMQAEDTSTFGNAWGPVAADAARLERGDRVHVTFEPDPKKGEPRVTSILPEALAAGGAIAPAPPAAVPADAAEEGW